MRGFGCSHIGSLFLALANWIDQLVLMEVEDLLKTGEIRPQGYKFSKIEYGAGDKTLRDKERKTQIKEEPLVCWLQRRYLNINAATQAQALIIVLTTKTCCNMWKKLYVCVCVCVCVCVYISICVCMCIYIYINYIKICAVKRLIESKIKVFVYICMCAVYIYVYK